MLNDQVKKNSEQTKKENFNFVLYLKPDHE
jgi:hypothetical protein